MISFERIDVNDMPWERLRDFNGASIFHTRYWIDLLKDFVGAEPVIAAVQSDGQTQGYFTGLITKKLGLKILGSPFRGWNTDFMGFNLMPSVLYHEVLQAFPKFAFGELGCHFLMIVDINLKEDECKGLKYQVRKFTNFALDLTKSEAELYANMKGHSCRHSIQRAIKRGVVIEEATDPGFAQEYYTQYQEVMAKQSLATLYGLDFVRKMVAQLQPTGNLLLLRARNAEGVCIATSIDFVFNKVAVGWGAASLRQYQSLNPNELMYWYEMKRVKGMGAEVFHLANTKEQFKKKFGAYDVQGFRLMKARKQVLFYPLFIALSINERVRLWKGRVLGW
jgi:hypothetical protein